MHWTCTHWIVSYFVSELYKAQSAFVWGYPLSKYLMNDPHNGLSSKVSIPSVLSNSPQSINFIITTICKHEDLSLLTLSHPCTRKNSCSVVNILKSTTTQHSVFGALGTVQLMDYHLHQYFYFNLYLMNKVYPWPHKLHMLSLLRNTLYLAHFGII